MIRKPRELKVYIHSNIDGRHAAMVASHNQQVAARLIGVSVGSLSREGRIIHRDKADGGHPGRKAADPTSEIRYAAMIGDMICPGSLSPHAGGGKVAHE